MAKRSLLFVFALLFLAACTVAKPDDEGAETSSSARSSVSSQRAIDVLYEGIVRTAGVSIYMEGTHKLMIDGGGFILLQSDALDLNGYIGERVRVRGKVRPTTEGDASIMSVEQVQLAAGSSESSSDSSSSASAPLTLPSSASSASSLSFASLAPRSSSARSEAGSLAPRSSSAKSEAGSASSVSNAMEGRAEAMANDDLSPSQWSQKYCTAHIGFCIPIHKQWWFKSFGTTTSSLWRVEISSEEIVSIGDGPIVINLISGSIASVGATDGQIKEEGNMVVGFRNWTDNRHFEIRAPSSLTLAVQYIAQSLVSYEEPGA